MALRKKNRCVGCGQPARPSRIARRADCGLPPYLAEGYRQAAKDMYYDEGMIEVDASAPISAIAEGREGAYVQAWVWVPGGDVADPQTLALEESEAA
jgi:hypothetical protein